MSKSEDKKNEFKKLVAKVMEEDRLGRIDKVPPSSWLSSWTDPVQLNAKNARWEKLALNAKLSELSRKEATEIVGEFLSNLNTKSVGDAVDNFVDRLYPPMISNGPADT